MKKILFLTLTAICFFEFSAYAKAEGVVLANCKLSAIKVMHATAKSSRIADASKEISAEKPSGTLSIETEIGRITGIFDLDEDGGVSSVRFLFVNQNIVVWGTKSKDDSFISHGAYDDGENFIIGAKLACAKN